MAELAGYVDGKETNRVYFKIKTGKLIGKRPLGRRKYRWENTIRINLLTLLNRCQYQFGSG